MKKKTYLILGGVLFLVLVGVIGFTYAYWMITKEQTNFNIVNSDCFEIEFQESNDINLNRAYPISDADGLKLVPYTFTITNKCESWASFQINLETIEQTGVKVLPDHYLKVNLQEGSSNKITTKLDKTINTEIDTSTTIRGATEAYKLLTGTLKSGGSKTYNLRLWMDSEVTAENEDSMNASYAGKVSITFSYQSNPFAESGTLMATSQTNTNAFWGYKESITMVVIEPEMTGKDTELLWDISANQDGSVMSYLVLNEKADASEANSYTLYLQSKGGIKANENSSHLFYNFTNLKTIEGLEYFDTSNVIKMWRMFQDCRSLTNLDVSHFDTSNVTNMEYMFNGCSNLTSLDVSHFDTGNVTTMYGIFGSCSSLISLDVSHFGTSNVTTMNYMFSGCSNLTNLDLSNFDTSKVTEMFAMFSGCSNLTNLDLSHFYTGKVTNMGYMFNGCSNLTDLNLGFITTTVTNMDHMFSSCRSLISLDLSHFDTSNAINMNRMFYHCSKLIDLDLSNFDIGKVTTAQYIFTNMPSNSTLKVKDQAMQNWILTSDNGHPSEWSASNVVIKTASN